VTDTKAGAAAPSGWRRWGVFLARLLFGFLAVGLAAGFAQMGIAPYAPDLVEVGVAALASALVLVAFVRWTEGRWPNVLAIRAAPAGLAAGVGLGIVLSALSVGALWALGYYRIEAIAPRAQWAGLALGGLVLSTSSAVVEEALFRGVLFRQIAQHVNPAVAILVSAVFFGAAHLVNPNATLAAAAGLMLEAGVLLGVGYVLTRSLWLPIGLHFSWNFMQAVVVGGALSGAHVTSIITAKLEGPALMSGGAFGIEGSLITIGVCAAGALSLYALTRARGVKWLSPLDRL